jgi:autotransporter-associated beta strand protein
MLIQRGLCVTALVSLALAARGASAQSDPVGYQALLASFSAAGLPAPGTGVVVEQTEAALNPNGPAPYQYLPQASYFSGVTITDESSGGTISSHATTVGTVFYGTTGYATGVTQVDAYNASSWLGSVLRVGSSVPPAPPLFNNPSVANFSWLTSYGGPTYDNDALRRFDYMIDRDNFVGVVACNNGAGTPIPSVLASAYNSICVGLSNGQSSTGPVPSGDVDGAGRSKPDLVAPSSEVSYTLPEVSAAAAMLVQVARSKTTLSAGTNAAVVKAILMAGANKNPLPSWTHSSTQPLDPQYGAGQLNFNSAYQIMAAGPQTASASSLAASTGWSYSSLNPNGSAGNTATYYFNVPSGQPVDLSALLTWQRNVTYFTSSAGSLTFTPSLATIDLNLYQANSNFTLGSLVASSSSSIDNVQYVFDRGLAAGEYALQVTRADAISGAWNYALAWQLQSVPQWVAAVNGSWNSAANWTSGVVPNGGGLEAALIAPTASGVSVSLDTPQTLGQLTLANSASPSTGYTITAGSAGTLTFSNSGANAVLNINSGSQLITAPVILASNLTVTPAPGSGLEIAGNISGASGLTLNGPGSLIFAGSNTFSGGVTISAGTLQIGAGGASGTPGGGAITDNGTLAVDRSDTYTMPVAIGGSGGVVALGPGTLVLATSNSYIGTTVISSGALRLTQGLGLPSASPVVLAGGVLESSGAFLRGSGNGANAIAWTTAGGGFSANGGGLVVNLFDNGQTITWSSGLQGPLKFGSATANSETTWINPIDLSGADRTIQVTAGQGGDFARILGPITNSSGTAGVIKTGNGLLALAGADTYNGNTTIAVGTLQISSSANLGSGALVFGGSGTGVLNVVGSASLTNGTAIVLSQNGTIQQDDQAPLHLAGRISGSGELIKSGSGVLDLDGTNTYTGATIVTSGKLVANNSLALSGGGLIVGANAATLFGDALPATIPSDPGSTDSSSPLATVAGSDNANALAIPEASSSAVIPAVQPVSLSPVPEPGTLWLGLVAAGGGLVWLAHTQRRGTRKALLRLKNRPQA